MTPQFKKIVAYSLSIALGLFLLYLAMRGVDLEELKTSLKNAAYGWVIPVIILILISHALRAWRWQMLLEALPDQQRTGHLNSIPFKTAFLSLLIGYFANLLAPRLGEVARAGNLSRHEGIRFSGVFGTVVAERVFDMFVLALGIASLSVMFYEESAFLQDRILSPFLSVSQKFSFGWTVFGLTGVGTLSYFALRSIQSSQSSRVMQLRRRLNSVLTSFKDGMLTLLRAPRRVALIGSTLAMWFCYVIMAYLTFIILDMHTVFNLGLSAAWAIMIFGAIGFAIPSPGGTGSFHYVAKLALVNLYFVDDATAIAYTVLSHGLHVIVYVIAGILALFLQGTTLKTLRTTTLDTD